MQFDGVEKAYGLAGQTALVTGGGTGIGLAIATCLNRAGAKVIIAGRRTDVLDDAAAAIGDGVATAPLDITDIGGLAAFEAELAERHGAMDILVNNAGNTVRKPFEEMVPDDIDAVLRVHLTGALELSRHVIRRQLAHDGGTVLFLASMTSFIGQPLVLGYTAAKSALVGVVRGLSAEFAGRGIRVNAIAPGWIETDLFKEATQNDPERLAKILARIQTGAIGAPEDIGWTAAFLCSPAARYITGQTIVVDGGAAIGF